MLSHSVNRMICLLIVLLLLGCGSASPGDAAIPAESAAPTAKAVPKTTPVPTEEPTPVPTPEPSPVPTEETMPEPTPVPARFSLAWIPDTQKLSVRSPELLTELGREIAAHRESDAIVGVLHTGDIVDNGWKAWQWDNFDRCLNELNEAGLPFYPVAGNHDLGVERLRYDAYLKRPFLKTLPEAQTFAGGKLYYLVLNEGGVSLLLLGIGWDGAREEEELRWVKDVLESHAELPCILLTHAYAAYPGERLSYCRYLEQEIVSKYANIRIVLCGHMRGFFSDVQTFDDDGDGEAERTVNVLMLDNQDGAFLWRVLTFDPATRALTVRTHAIGSDAPVGNDPKHGDPADFVLENAF